MSENKKPFKQFELRWKDRVGLPECPYMTRWVIVLMGYALRLHHWIASDDQRYKHDHGWWMLILVLWGGYTDVTDTGEDVLRAGSIRLRSATHRHTVRVNKGGCWSLLLTGPKLRKWGFYKPGSNKMIRPLRFFDRIGHHPCE